MKNSTPPELKIGDIVRRLFVWHDKDLRTEEGIVLALGRKFRGSKAHPSAKVDFPSVRVPRWYFVDQLEAVSNAESNEAVKPQ